MFLFGYPRLLFLCPPFPIFFFLLLLFFLTARVIIARSFPRSFFSTHACIHHQSPFPRSSSISFGKPGLYGHETRPGKRHVSEPGNENVADATRFRRWSMRADRCILLLLTIPTERITLARSADHDQLASNNLSRVCFTGRHLVAEREKRHFHVHSEKFMPLPE